MNLDYSNNSTISDQLNESKINVNKKSNNHDAWTAALCGGLAGLTSRAVSSPLDVIKIRLQIQEHSHIDPTARNWKYRGLVGAFRTILKEEGVRGFWKGNMSAEYLYVTYGACQFWTYRQVDDALGRQNHIQLDHFAKSFLAGATSGATATITTYPFDLLRTRFAIQGHNAAYQSVIGAFRSIYSLEGFSGFYKGLNLTLLQIIPYMGLMFGCYDVTKSTLNRLPGTSSFEDVTKDSIAGAASGLFSKLGVYPLDLVKKRLQVQSRTVWEGAIVSYTHHHEPPTLATTVRTIYHREGVRGFYRGVVPALLKSIPTSMTTFLVFGFCQRCFSTQEV